MQLQATKRESFLASDYADNFDGATELIEAKGHRYDVTDGEHVINVMEWDDVANGDSADSHIKSNEDCGSFDKSEVLAAVRAAY